MNNIVNEKVEDYIRNTLRQSEGLLLELEEYAKQNHVPIIHKEVSDMIKVLLKMQRPKRILEIGCAIGYSSIFFANALEKNVEIITCERNEKMIEIAKSNIQKA
ncbi:MAG: O-methyltransferase, partial [Clostridioides sp.]|nr:O-methyltransferase [Clostridioides sp.]